MSGEAKIVSVEEMAEKIMQLNSWPELLEFGRAIVSFPSIKLYNDAIQTSVKVQEHIAGLPGRLIYKTKIAKVEKIATVKEMAKQLMQLSTGKEFFEFLKALETSNPAASTGDLPNWAKQYNDAKKDPKVQAHIERLISDGSRARLQANSAT